MKKIMDFLFGKKYPIFNEKGEIRHSQEGFFKKWKKSYQDNPEKNWKNHTGMFFKDKKSKS